MTSDFKIKDIKLADWGRDEISIAESEMPGLMALRSEYANSKPLKGARIAGCLHVTVQTAVLIETLICLGADIRWSSCNPLSTQDQAAAALAKNGVKVFAWKGQSETEYWDAVKNSITDQHKWTPNLLLDDGADLISLIHEEYQHLIKDIKGASEETTSGINRLYDMKRKMQLKMPVINVNDSVTKSKFDNLYGCRHSLVDGLNRATDMMLSGKLVVVCGFGSVGRGCALGLRGQGARVVITEIDPICALQAAMEGYEVVKLEDVCHKADLFVTATGNIDVITIEHMRLMKDRAVLCNIGHFCGEIRVTDLANTKRHEIKSQVEEFTFADGKRLILLAGGRLVNLACATGHPSFVMSASFTNQVLAQIELWSGKHSYENDIYVLPKHLDEKVASLHLAHLGAELSTLSDEQAEYIGVSSSGPFKSRDYRY